MKKKSTPIYKIVAINVKNSPDSDEIYDCTHKDSIIDSDIDFENINLKHYSEIAVLKIKRKNTKKKNLVYTVFKNTNGVLEILSLKESDFVNYMTRAEFKKLTREFYNYEDSLEKSEKEK